MEKMYKTILRKGLSRYDGKAHRYEKKLLRLLRKGQNSSGLLKKLFKTFYIFHCKKRNIEFPIDINVGPGLYFGHTFGITVNPETIIGKNYNIHKNVTIGQENRGMRKGAPVIGNNVYIGIGSSIVGKITIGDDVLIAPGAYVNVDVPSLSIVIGNPCRIHQQRRRYKMVYSEWGLIS